MTTNDGMTCGYPGCDQKPREGSIVGGLGYMHFDCEEKRSAEGPFTAFDQAPIFGKSGVRVDNDSEDDIFVPAAEPGEGIMLRRPMMRDVWKDDASDVERRISSLEVAQAFLETQGKASLERGRRMIAAARSITNELEELK